MRCAPNERALSGPCDDRRTFHRSCRQSSLADIVQRRRQRQPLHCDWPADGQRLGQRRHGHGRPHGARGVEHRQHFDDGTREVVPPVADGADVDADADDVAGAADVAAVGGDVADADGTHYAPWYDDHHELWLPHAHLLHCSAVAELSSELAIEPLALDDHDHCWTLLQDPYYDYGCDGLQQLLLPLHSSVPSHPN